MKERFPIFIDIPSITSIAENHFRNFESIFKNRAVVYLDASESDIAKIETLTENTVTSDIALYFNEIDVSPRPGKNVIEKFIKQEKAISNEINGCVFILDISRKKARNLSNDYGVWVLSKEDIESDPDVECIILDEIRMDNEDVKPGEQFGSFSENGWIKLFDDRIKLFPPFNEIILYDNFLNEYVSEYAKVPPYFVKTANGRKWKYTYIGLENLLLLFDAILPNTHINPIKILIVLPKNHIVKHEQNLENRIEAWIGELKCLRNYDMFVSFLLIGNTKWKEDSKESHPLHPRVLYTNYFFIGTEKGFKIFEPYPYSNIVRKDGDSKNSISVASLFSTPRMLSNPIKTNYNSKLKDIGEQLRKKSLGDTTPQNNNLIGDNISIESFSLFDSIDFDLY